MKMFYLKVKYRFSCIELYQYSRKNVGFPGHFLHENTF